MTTTRTIRTRGLEVFLREAGQDRPGEDPVVLLHGFPQTSHMWRHQLPVLGERFRVYAPDTRGYGGTEKPRIRVTRDLLARDVVDLLDALGIERARLVGHDWGGIIAAATALKHPDRVSRLALIDTLVSVWITWGIHGYWFKCEPEAERFFEAHHRAFIRSVFAGEPTPYGGPPESPWAGVEGSEGSAALDGFDPTRFWSAEDVAHYEQAFSDPGAWFHAVEYYRHALPFHVARPDPEATGGMSFEYRTSRDVAAMWKHEGLLASRVGERVHGLRNRRTGRFVMRGRRSTCSVLPGAPGLRGRKAAAGRLHPDRQPLRGLLRAPLRPAHTGRPLRHFISSRRRLSERTRCYLVPDRDDLRRRVATHSSVRSDCPVVEDWIRVTPPATSGRRPDMSPSTTIREPGLLEDATARAGRYLDSLADRAVAADPVAVEKVFESAAACPRRRRRLEPFSPSSTRSRRTRRSRARGRASSDSCTAARCLGGRERARDGLGPERSA
ncbi:MAG: alpha/beta hydrolase [Myxococcota bacterium]